MRWWLNAGPGAYDSRPQAGGGDFGQSGALGFAWCKEWAEGLAREAAVIESDWAALRWALGSTRILLQDRDPLESPAEVPMAAAMLAGQIRQRTWIICPIVLFEAVCFAGFFPPMHSPMQRAGCGLIKTKAKTAATAKATAAAGPSPSRCSGSG